MSTRSIIVITGTPNYNGEEQTIRLYKHSDGYPTGNLPVIKSALSRGIEQVEQDNARWKNKRFSNAMLRPEQVAALIIGESASIYGFGAKLDVYNSDEACYYTGITEEALGSQADLEWIYVIDLNEKSLRIYSGDQTDVLNGKMKNPDTYVKQLREDCQKDELKETHELVDAIQKLGFSVNKKQRKLKAV